MEQFVYVVPVIVDVFFYSAVMNEALKSASLCNDIRSVIWGMRASQCVADWLVELTYECQLP
jgi:hypothetical protein